MKLFRRKKRESLNESQGVPNGTFRCDVCKFVLPDVCLGGAVVDLPPDNPSRVYTLCGVCAVWLGFGEFRFPPPHFCFKFSDGQRKKIRALQRELDITKKHTEREVEVTKKHLEEGVSPSIEDLERIHKFLESAPNAREFIRLRFSLVAHKNY